MRLLKNLLEQNRAWSARMRQGDPKFFERLATRQSPEYLWIGCSDSRVPANQIVDLMPGDIFVHRNVANVVVHTDLNCLSVLQFAVDVLKVKHVIVCGHYGCGGIRAAHENTRLGLIDNWLRHVQDVANKHRPILERASDDEARLDALAELNVIEQVTNVSQTTIVRDAWQRGQQLSVHSWIYSLRDGELRDLSCCTTATEEIATMHSQAIQLVESRLRR